MRTSSGPCTSCEVAAVINQYEIFETIRMIENDNLDIRTITMGISLLDCVDADMDRLCEKVYEKTD